MSSTTTTNPILASELFSISQGSANTGNGRWQCHWCGSKECLNEFTHDDVAPVPFIRSKSTAKCPVEPYICYGCWLWRRGKVTINLLAGGFKDGQLTKNHSWWITEEGAWALVSKLDYDEVWKLLIKPPKKFVLALRRSKDKIDTLIQLALANDPGGIVGETVLYFTLNNIPHSFTVYELTESVKLGKESYGPGVRALWDFLGEPPEEVRKKIPPPKDEPRKQGERQHKDNPKKTVKKVIQASGG